MYEFSMHFWRSCCKAGWWVPLGERTRVAALKVMKILPYNLREESTSSSVHGEVTLSQTPQRYFSTNQCKIPLQKKKITVSCVPPAWKGRPRFGMPQVSATIVITKKEQYQHAEKTSECLGGVVLKSCRFWSSCWLSLQSMTWSVVPSLRIRILVVYSENGDLSIYHSVIKRDK